MGFVVAGVDGSEMSTAALVWSMRFAQAMKHEVIAVTGFVIPWTIFITPTYQEENYAYDAQQVLERSIGEARSVFPEVPVESRLVQERPTMALLMASRGAELLVVGAHGHSELPIPHIGSTATACINHAPCPVVVFRDSQGRDID